MNDINYALQNLWASMFQIVPSAVKALLILLVTVVIAKLVRKAVEKALLKLKVDKFYEDKVNAQEGKSFVGNIAQLTYYLVILLFLPAILEVLGVSSISQPFINLFNTFFGFLPNLLGAGLILVVGYYVAKLAHDFVKTALDTAGADNLFAKFLPSTETELDISALLAKIVFGIVLIPVITSSLDILNLTSLSAPIAEILNQILLLVPRLFLAVALLVIGYVIAQFVGELVSDLLENVGVNKILTDNQLNLANLSGQVVQGVILLFMSVEALNVLNLEVLNNVGSSIIAFLPNLLSAGLIITLGVVGGILLEGLINKHTETPFTAAIAKYVVIIFAVFMTLEQVKFASTIVTTAFMLVLGALSVAFALAFGLGGKDFATKQLTKFENKMETENKKPVPENNPIDRLKK